MVPMFGQKPKIQIRFGQRSSTSNIDRYVGDASLSNRFSWTPNYDSVVVVLIGVNEMSGKMMEKAESEFEGRAEAGRRW